MLQSQLHHEVVLAKFSQWEVTIKKSYGGKHLGLVFTLLSYLGSWVRGFVSTATGLQHPHFPCSLWTIAPLAPSLSEKLISRTLVCHRIRLLG